MKKEIADKWVEALRSGKFKQIKGHLCSTNGYCCLGVLSELATSEEVCGKEHYPHLGITCFDDANSVLPTSVKEWSGMKHLNGSFSIKGETLDSCLAEMNDNDIHFNEIADTIEKYWELI